jgi:hypothetical protein
MIGYEYWPQVYRFLGHHNWPHFDGTENGPQNLIGHHNWPHFEGIENRPQK